MTLCDFFCMIFKFAERLQRPAVQTPDVIIIVIHFMGDLFQPLVLDISGIKHLHIFRTVERLNFADDFVLQVGVFPDQRGDFLPAVLVLWYGTVNV